MTRPSVIRLPTFQTFGSTATGTTTVCTLTVEVTAMATAIIAMLLRRGVISPSLDVFSHIPRLVSRVWGITISGEDAVLHNGRLSLDPLCQFAEERLDDGQGFAQGFGSDVESGEPDVRDLFTIRAVER